MVKIDTDPGPESVQHLEDSDKITSGARCWCSELSRLTEENIPLQCSCVVVVVVVVVVVLLLLLLLLLLYLFFYYTVFTCYFHSKLMYYLLFLVSFLVSFRQQVYLAYGVLFFY